MEEQIKPKFSFDDILVKIKEKPQLYVGILVGLIIFLGIIIFIIVWSNSSGDNDYENAEVVEVVENPLLTEEEKKELCSNAANRILKTSYDFVWDNSTTINFSQTEESHQLKGYYDLYNEVSILAQCNIESGRFKDSEVRVSILPEEYYTLDKFNLYLRHCEDLGGKLKGRGGYGHGMIGSCSFDNGTLCDLREFYRGDCK